MHFSTLGRFLRPADQRLSHPPPSRVTEVSHASALRNLRTRPPTVIGQPSALDRPLRALRMRTPLAKR